MKTKLQKVFFLLLFLPLLLPGCFGPENESDKIVTYLVCKSKCDELREQYRDEFENCRFECLSTKNSALINCDKLPLNEQDRCSTFVEVKYTQCLEACESTWNEHEEEIRQCRIECNKLITKSEE